MGKALLYGVSVGPGDPELLTLKALRIIKEADVIAVPNTGQRRQLAYDIAKPYLEGKEILDCYTPMARDHNVALEAYKAVCGDICALLDAGKSVAYLVLGDASVYSTYTYIHAMVQERGYATEIVPGVPSFCAVAATLQKPLCEGSQRLLVVPAFKGGWEDAFNISANKVFMKTGKTAAPLKQALIEQGLLENTSMVANCGLPDEQIFEHFAEADDDTGYFSVVIVKDKA